MAEQNTPITGLVLPETDRHTDMVIERLRDDDESLEAYLKFMHNSLRRFYRRPTNVALRVPLYALAEPGSQQISELLDYLVEKTGNPNNLKQKAINRTVWIAREVASSAITGALEIQKAKASTSNAPKVPIIRELVDSPDSKQSVRSLVSVALAFVALSHFSGTPGTIGAELKLYARMNDTDEVQNGVARLIKYSGIFRRNPEVMSVRLEGGTESWKEAHYTADEDIGIPGIRELLLDMSPELKELVSQES